MDFVFLVPNPRASLVVGGINDCSVTNEAMNGFLVFSFPNCVSFLRLFASMLSLQSFTNNPGHLRGRPLGLRRVLWPYLTEVCPQAREGGADRLHLRRKQKPYAF